MIYLPWNSGFAALRSSGDHSRNLRKIFKIPIVEGYGLTEGTCVSTINPRVGVRKIGSIGLALPGQEIKIVDENGNESPRTPPAKSLSAAMPS